MIPIAEPSIDQEAIDRVTEVLESGLIADGPEVRAFEEEFAAATSVRKAIATSNGTTALHAALAALGVGQGDRVITTPFSFIATANAARLVGADVEFVDIREETYNIDPQLLEQRLENGPPVDAVIAVHLYGLPAQLDHLADLSEAYDFALIEDAAQAHGATFDGEPVGSIGDAGCFSFYPTKNMTTGEGGMITTDRSTVAERARRFIDHGRESGYRHVSVGHNFRMTSLAAAIGRVQLRRLPTFTEKRRENAAALDTALAELPVVTPAVPTDRTHVYHQYTIRTEHRDEVQERLAGRDIASKVYYPIPIHHQPAYADVTTNLPVAERLANEVLSVPVHPGVDDRTLTTIVNTVAGLAEVRP